jgi:uncharacterized protein (DUF1697 family)
VRRPRPDGGTARRRRRPEPWPERAATPKQLNVAFLSGPPAVSAGPARVGDQEGVHVDGDHAYVWYGAGQGRSRLSLDPLGVTATVRNWTTVTALADMAVEAAT